MNRFKNLHHGGMLYYSIAILSLLLSFSITSCSNDDNVTDRSETDILGIWTDNPEHFIDLSDTEFITEYTLDRSEYGEFWIKTKVSYFYEPYSYLLLKDSKFMNNETFQMDSHLSLFRVVSYDDHDMVLCWLSDPEIGSMEGDGKYDFFKIFFEDDYDLDPENYKYYKKVTAEELTEGLGDIQVMEL